MHIPLSAEIPNLKLLILISCYHFFPLKMLSEFYICCIHSSTLQTRFCHGSKQYEPWSDCSASGEQFVVGQYFLQYGLPKNIKQMGRADNKSGDRQAQHLEFWGLSHKNWLSVNKETFLTLCLLEVTFVICRLPLQTVWIQIRTNKMSVLIWIQTIWHSDSVPEIIFWKS